MKTLIIASRNRKKRDEIRAILKGLKVKVISLDELCLDVPEVIEDGATFRENAVKKAVQVSRLLDAFTLADDSGLEVDALDGKPGVRSARFAGEKAADADNNAKLIRMMKKISPAKRGASFVCDIAIADKGKLLKVVEGRCRGRLAPAPLGETGFGYDPLFIPNGYKRTFAEMSPEEKNSMSHRGKALVKAAGFIAKYL